jgi:hypothetical protein
LLCLFLFLAQRLIDVRSIGVGTRAATLLIGFPLTAAVFGSFLSGFLLAVFGSFLSGFLLARLGFLCLAFLELFL